MDIAAFVHHLLRHASALDCFERIGLQVEGPIAQGHGYISADVFLRFYFNEKTGTIAFALIQHGERVWGIDRDNARGWHLHPADAPTSHVAIEAQTVGSMLDLLKTVLDARASRATPDTGAAGFEGEHGGAA